ncbi:MAG: ImmA/IrrE family metallo-endopeptidase [Chitinophagales bacterium]
MPSNIIKDLDASKIGPRLRIARERRNMSQVQVAEILNVSRTTIVAIEQGKRKIKSKELILLAQTFGISVSDILNPRITSSSFNVQYRAANFRTKDENEEVGPVIEEWERLCQDYYFLEEILNTPLSKRYPEEYTLFDMPIEIIAQNIATKERNRLGIGDGPVRGLREILEEEVGLRIFYIKMPNKFSEIYAFDDNLGGCLAININHPEERQRWSLAHGYLHFLVHRKNTVYHYDNQYSRMPLPEQLAESYAKHFLMPTYSVSKHFARHKEKGRFEVEDLLSLADFFGVGVETITIRLEDLKLLPTGTWEYKIKGRNLKIREAQDKLGLRKISKERGGKYPLNYMNMAIKALDRGLITEGKFAKLLDVNRLEARSIAIALRENAVNKDVNFNDIDLSIK